MKNIGVSPPTLIRLIEDNIVEIAKLRTYRLQSISRLILTRETT